MDRVSERITGARVEDEREPVSDPSFCTLWEVEDEVVGDIGSKDDSMPLLGVKGDCGESTCNREADIPGMTDTD